MASAQTIPRPVSRPWTGRRLQRHLTGYAFVAPALLVFAAFIIYPIFYSVWLSFHVWNGFSAGWESFVGLRNYQDLFADEVFWKATVNSIVFVLFRTPLEVGIGFGLALLLNQRLPGRSLLRTLFFVPVVMSLIVVTILFQRILEPNTGLLNAFLRGVGLGGLAHSWLGDPATVLADPHVKRAYLGEEDEVLVDPDDAPARTESAA